MSVTVEVAGAQAGVIGALGLSSKMIGGELGPVLVKLSSHLPFFTLFFSCLFVEGVLGRVNKKIL